ncbi:hypothetical protein WA026_015804, partial [Henosepilachna vigintioctopunctata]
MQIGNLLLLLSCALSGLPDVGDHHGKSCTVLRQAEKFTSPSNRQYYMQYKREYIKEIRKAKIAANDDYINSASNPTKSMWQIINKNIGNIKRNIESSGLTSEDFNNYFLGIANRLVKDMEKGDIDPLDNLRNMDIPNHFTFSKVTFNE